MDPNITVTARVWCTPRADNVYPWKWAVQDGECTLEFGAEPSEDDAKLEATAARASWLRILTKLT